MEADWNVVRLPQSQEALRDASQSVCAYTGCVHSSFLLFLPIFLCAWCECVYAVAGLSVASLKAVTLCSLLAQALRV